ncbi:sulfite exporter TauE/SafE family protein [Mesorhizobium retamae]|uniref:Probable membrane transporter protein n=1 Tax=Mesorhizobium retamae TaxID=2912854 RepID=A0ABS9Q8M2_9HYPH|nr:sulfite exporter TauE/SafE family protein [Mesorhizobium sp. IRAMC:0171]MCG7503763.1 sulfite exporter TauE/SafE family protein [Mesorhizobium sp. IRAMC:0171]
MFDPSVPLLVTVAATFFAAGVVKGVTGMGLPTVAMGVLGAALSPLAAANLLIIPSAVTNVWQLLAGPSLGALIRRFWPMMLTIVAGTILGSAWLAAGDTGVTTTALGIALVFYSAYTLFASQLDIDRYKETWLSPLVGAVTGLITGGTGVFVIPAVPYLQALRLGKDDLVQALGLSFTVSTLALAAGLGIRGAFQAENLALSGLAVVPALAGMWFGQILRTRISPPLFRKIFLFSLLALGFEISLRPLL